MDFSISASMVLHVSISFHGHIWLLEANLFGEEKQHIFCKFGITPRCLAPESPSWELECEPPPRCQWGSCKPPWRGIQWVNAASVLTLRRLMQGYRYRVVPGSEGFAHPSGWGEARLSISNIFWVTYTVYIYIIYIYLFGFEPLRMVMFDKISLATAWHRDMIEARNIRGTLFPKKRWGLNRSEASNWGMAASWNCAQFSSGTMR